MENIKGVTFEIVKTIEQTIEHPDGWPVRAATGLAPGEFGYHFNFSLDDGQEVTLTLTESAITEMLNKVKTCRTKYGG